MSSSTERLLIYSLMRLEIGSANIDMVTKKNLKPSKKSGDDVPSSTNSFKHLLARLPMQERVRMLMLMFLSAI
jgi:hypothetical protein